MVFNGRPSAGCTTCKLRKKKCDLKKPSCDRCVKSGKRCPGIPDSVDLLFRHEFVQRNNISSSSNLEKRPILSVPQQPTAFAITVPVPTDWIYNAATYYHMHCNRGPHQGQLNTWAKLLTRHYATSNPGTGLYHAFNALAVLKISKDMHMPQLVDMANTSYGYALRAINRTLCDEVDSTRNDVALAVFAMTTFELSPQNLNRHGRYVAHIEGMKQLLVLRGRQQLADVEALEVFRALRIQIVYDHILRGKSLTDNSDGSIWTSEDSSDANPMNDLCAIAPRIPRLRACVKSHNNHSYVHEIDRMIAEALSVDSALKMWYRRWKHHLKYEIRSIPRNDLGVWRNQAYIFQDVAKAILVTNYCFLRIQVLDALLQAKRMTIGFDRQQNDQLSRIECNIQELIDTICYSLPSITGQVKWLNHAVHSEDNFWTYPSHAEATWILVPIVAAAQHGLISESQKSWLRLQLVYLNVDFGLVDRDSFLDEHDVKQDLTPYWNIDTPHEPGLKIPVSKPVPYRNS